MIPSVASLMGWAWSGLVPDDEPTPEPTPDPAPNVVQRPGRSADPIDLDDPHPPWANTAYVINGEQTKRGPLRKCPPCEVEWYGFDPCWACGQPGQSVA